MIPELSKARDTFIVFLYLLVAGRLLITLFRAICRQYFGGIGLLNHLLQRYDSFRFQISS